MLRKFEIDVRKSGRMPKMIYTSCCRLRNVVCMQNELHRNAGPDNLVAREEMLERITGSGAK